MRIEVGQMFVLGIPFESLDRFLAIPNPINVDVYIPIYNYMETPAPRFEISEPPVRTGFSSKTAFTIYIRCTSAGYTGLPAHPNEVTSTAHVMVWSQRPARHDANLGIWEPHRFPVSYIRRSTSHDQTFP